MTAPRRTTVKRLTNAPLVLVLSQVRFSPILAIETLVPDIQEKLRRSGLPGFDRLVSQQIEFSVDGPPKITGQTSWVFRSPDRKRIVTLDTGSVALQVMDYVDFEDFVAFLSPVLEALVEVAQPSFYERIGLRYVNAVANIGAEAMPTYFQDTVLSFSAEQLNVDKLLTGHQSVGTVDSRQIVLRMNQVQDSPLLPPDLVSPELRDLSEPQEGVHAILDIDGSDFKQGPFDNDQIENQLWGVHELTENAFWEATSVEAHEKWGLVQETREP